MLLDRSAAVWPLLLLLLLALVEPSRGDQETEYFEIPVISSHHKTDLKALAARHAHGHGSTGAVPLNHGGLWTVVLEVGKDKLDVDLDTEPSQLIVQGGLYHPKHSSTARDLGRTMHFGFGYGTNVAGFDAHLYEDVVKLGPLQGRVTVARTLKANETVLSLDGGLLGLTSHGFLSDLRKSNQWNGIYSLDIRKDGGLMSFGTPKEQMTWYPTHDDNIWFIRGEWAGTPFKAVVDSGTPAIGLPIERFKRIVALYPQHLSFEVDENTGLHLMTGPCDFVPDLPFKFGNGIEVHLTAEAWWFYGPAEREGYCYSGITGSKGVPDDDPWLLGDPFFSVAYISFDTVGHRIGIKPK